jgi:hypothetical protein
VTASIDRAWNDNYDIPYTKEYKYLKKTLEYVLQEELKNLEGFKNVQIMKFFKGSVKFEFRVYFDQSSPVNDDSLTNKIESADTEALGKIAVLKVETDEDRTRKPPNESKPFLQLWMIVVIVAGVVVFIYTIVLIVLMVSVVKSL